MATKKTADLSGLVATKGAAAPVAGMPVRAPAPRSDDTETANNEPLNFRVSSDFRRRFRMFAAAHDMKLNELLRVAFEEYEKKHG